MNFGNPSCRSLYNVRQLAGHYLNILMEKKKIKKKGNVSHILQQSKFHSRMNNSNQFVMDMTMSVSAENVNTNFAEF